MTPLLTVFIPAFNCAHFVKDAIESVIASDTRDLEIVVVDDGSSDATLERAKQIRHPALRLFRNQTNLGIAATRDRSLPLFRGQYLALLDADDTALPDRFDRQIERLESPGGPDVLGGCMQMFGDREGIVCPPASDALIRTALLFFSPIANPTVCMRLAPLRDGRLQYSTELGAAEDYDLWYQAARAGLRLENLDRVVTRYRCHGNSLTMSRADEVARQTERVRRKVIELYFPQLATEESDALAAAAGGRGWGAALEATAGIRALAYAATLAPGVRGIDADAMLNMLQEVLIAHTAAALADGILDNDDLEQLTESDERFERWRARCGGELDRRIVAVAVRA
jgi:hypothetical protein